MRRSPLRSPPRMRGKDPPAAAMQGCPGITPACAGKSTWVCPRRLKSRDHPRVCGEKFYVDEVLPGDTGSPPRMRGKGLIMALKKTYEGITPAYAGKSSPAGSLSPEQRDHPRVCGGKPLVGYRGKAPVGSPPRMRGKAALRMAPCQSRRITPAYAGKRKRSRLWCIWTGDHPRVCGEKPNFCRISSGSWGSPPRMRGKVCFAHGHRLLQGITPAYAGKSSRARLRCRCTWDHPRVCGEKKTPGVPFGASGGSPPRMRGKAEDSTQRQW